jgi:tetratricopeptide (TPR) repeat protein
MHDTIQESQELIRKGISLGRSRRYQEAIACFDKAIEINPNYAKVWCEKGICLGYLAKYDEAIECFDKALEIDPNELKPWFSKGVSLGILGKNEEAIPCFDKAIEINPNYAMAWSEKGLSLRYLGRNQEAIECYNRALEINPNYAKVWSDKGAILADLAKYEEAIECYDKSIEFNPNEAMPWRNKAQSLGHLGKYEEAIECYNKSLEINPNDTLVLINKGVSLDHLGKHEEAIEFYDKALEINPNDAITYCNKGVSLEDLGKHEEAIECYDKALEINPNDAMAWSEKGLSLRNLGKHEEAIECFDKALSIDPNSSKAWKAKASSLAYLGKHEEAIECFDKAIRIDQNDVEAWYSKGMALDRIGAYYESIKYYDKALQINPVNEQARIAKAHWISGRVNYFYSIGDLENVRNWAKKGLDICKPDITGGMATFLNNIGKSYEDQNDFDKAKEYYIMAKNVCPPDEPVWNAIHINLGALFHYRWNRPDYAEAYYKMINQQLLQRTDKYEYLQYLLRQARLEYSQGRFERALQIVDQQVLPTAFAELERSKNDSSTIDKIGSFDYKITIVNALMDYANYSNILFSYDGSKDHIDNAIKAIRKAIPYTQPLDQPLLLSLLGDLQLQWAMEIKKGRIKIDPQEQFTSDQAIQDLIKVAVENLSKSIELAKKIGHKGIIANATGDLGQCYHLINKIEYAEELLKKGIDLYEQMIADVKISNIRVGSEQYDKLNTILGDLCSLLIEEGREKEALGYTEIGKAREILNVDVTKSQIGCKKREECIDVINGLNDQLLVLNEKYRDLHKQADIEFPDSLIEEMNDIDSKYVALFQKKREIEDEIWKECPDPGVILPKNPEDIVNRFIKLSDDAFKNQHGSKRWALMEFTYLERQEQLVIFLLDYTKKLSIASLRLSNYDWHVTLPRSVKLFREAIETKSYEEAEKNLLENSSKLRNDIIPYKIAKILEDLGIQQLMVVSDGILNNMPLELITDSGKPLDACWGIKYALVRGFSMNHFSYQLQSNVITSAKGLILGNPTNMLIPKKEIYPFLNSNSFWLASLPGAEIEAENIGNILYARGGEPIMLLNKKASEENFIKEANSDSYAFIHFAGHAMFNSHDPDQSFLLLNKNGTMAEKTYANEIPAKVHLKDSPLVTLSSCESAVSEIKTGNEAFGLIRGFTLAGASNLLISGWSVFDDSAKEFMEQFYSRLYDKYAMSEAISHARLEILRRAENGQYKKKTKALHFAPFQLWGNPLRRMNPI